MVLDTIKNDTFVFKNTYEVDKQVRIAMDHKDAPSEFFFVHIRRKIEDPIGRPPSDSDISDEESS